MHELNDKSKMNQQRPNIGADARQKYALPEILQAQGRPKQGLMMGPTRQVHEQQEEVTDEEDCGDTDEHIIHAAASFNPSGMMSASDSGVAVAASPVGAKRQILSCG